MFLLCVAGWIEVFWLYMRCKLGPAALHVKFISARTTVFGPFFLFLLDDFLREFALLFWFCFFRFLSWKNTLPFFDADVSSLFSKTWFWYCLTNTHTGQIPFCTFLQGFANPSRLVEPRRRFEASLKAAQRDPMAFLSSVLGASSSASASASSSSSSSSFPSSAAVAAAGSSFLAEGRESKRPPFGWARRVDTSRFENRESNYSSSSSSSSSNNWFSTRLDMDEQR